MQIYVHFDYSFALLIGPLWGSGSLPWLYLLFGTPLILIMISAVRALFNVPSFEVHKQTQIFNALIF